MLGERTLSSRLKENHKLADRSAGHAARSAQPCQPPTRGSCAQSLTCPSGKDEPKHKPARCTSSSLSSCSPQAALGVPSEVARRGGQSDCLWDGRAWQAGTDSGMAASAFHVGDAWGLLRCVDTRTTKSGHRPLRRACPTAVPKVLVRAGLGTWQRHAEPREGERRRAEART